MFKLSALHIHVEHSLQWAMEYKLSFAKCRNSDLKFQAKKEKIVNILSFSHQVGTRLRNRIAEQLLTDLEPDQHETIMQLQAMEQQQSQTKYKV